MRWLMALVFVSGTAYADPEIVAPGDVPSSDTPAMPAMYTHPQYLHPEDVETSSMFIDFGGGMERFDDGGLTIHSNTLSFSPQATFHHNLYFGPEFYAADIDETWSGSVATMGGSQERMTHVTGALLGCNVVLGARARFGKFLSGAVELAGGFRRTSLKNEDMDLVVVDVNSSGTNRSIDQIDGILDLRGRIDAWVSPHFTIGVMGGKNLTDSSTMEAELRIGIHFERYDHSR